MQEELKDRDKKRRHSRHQEGREDPSALPLHPLQARQYHLYSHARQYLLYSVISCSSAPSSPGSSIPPVFCVLILFGSILSRLVNTNCILMLSNLCRTHAWRRQAAACNMRVCCMRVCCMRVCCMRVCAYSSDIQTSKKESSQKPTEATGRSGRGDGGRGGGVRVPRPLFPASAVFWRSLVASAPRSMLNELSSSPMSPDSTSRLSHRTRVSLMLY